MNREEIFNFSAGPSVLPEPVLRRAAEEMLNYGGSGMSVMEMSHRSSEFLEIFDGVKARLKAALSVPDSHEILFLQGGASMQFSMIPLNLTREGESADYAVTGHFAKAAAQEAERYCRVNVAASGEAENFTRIPRQEELRLDPQAKYFYYCANNTIFGTAWPYVPDTGDVPLCCDMSSEILSRPVDVGRYGLIFAGAQKNMAPAGLTVVILDRRLAGRERDITPLMLSYDRMIRKDSMYNTPPCYNIYLLGLVLDWLEAQGGVRGMEEQKRRKSGLLYEFLDESRLFRPCAQRECRSEMNVTFRTGDADLDGEFVKFAKSRGLLNLKGHRVAGGMRASLYNAMPMEGVERLVSTLKEFEVQHHV